MGWGLLSSAETGLSGLAVVCGWLVRLILGIESSDARRVTYAAT